MNAGAFDSEVWKGTWLLRTSCDFVEGTMIEALAKQFVPVDQSRENGVYEG